jgi:hypothetical protein
MTFDKTKLMYHRIFLRILFSVILTICAFGSLELLVYLGHSGISDINVRYPELMSMIRAISIYNWAETTAFVIRLNVESKTDTQRSVKLAEASGNGVANAILYAVHAFKWAFRITAVLYLAHLV